MRIIYDTNKKEGRPDNKLKTTYKHIFISTIFTMKNNNFGIVLNRNHAGRCRV